MPPLVYRGGFFFMNYTALRHLGANVMKKVIIALVSLIILASGAVLSSEGNRLTLRLFTHYLAGSGESMTLELPKFLDTHCAQPGLVSTYGTPYEWAFGRLTCREEGAYDLYDFSYEGNRHLCSRLTPTYYLRAWGHQRLGRAVKDTPANLGRCVVGHGYGRAFEVLITK
jgi:hypothetical protein